MTIERISVHIPGIRFPKKLIHISDTHITVPSADDDQKDSDAIAHGIKEWSSNGKTPLQNLEEILSDDEVKSADILVLTGDGTDSLTSGSLQYLENIKAGFKGKFIYVMGNHDTSHHDKELDYAKSVSMLMPLFDNEPDFHVVRLEDFTVVSLNAFKGSVSEEQYVQMKSVSAEGKPIVLASHMPLFTEETKKLIDKRFWEGASPYYLLGAPHSDSITAQFVDFVKSAKSNVVAYLSGHIHYSSAFEFAEGRMQYSAGPAFEGFVRIISIEP